MIDNPALRDAAGNTAVRNPSRTFLLSPGRRISREEEVFTPPRGGGRPAPEPQGVPREVRAFSGGQFTRWRSVSEEHWVAGGYVSGHSVAHAEGLGQEENRVLRTLATSQVIHAPRRAALTTTKVPRFDGTTSWEQYHQVFEAIVRSNGWDNYTAALQLFSHLERLVDALTAHYGSPGRLADFRRQFE